MKIKESLLKIPFNSKNIQIKEALEPSAFSGISPTSHDLLWRLTEILLQKGRFEAVCGSSGFAASRCMNG